MPEGRDIVVAPNPKRVRVLLAGAIVAESDRALTLFEPPRAPTHFVPLDDVAGELLEPSTHVGRCPHKGEARYFSVTAHGRTARDAAWTFSEPGKTVAALAGHVAFDPLKVDAVEELSRE
ncbi:MAG: DUF427 domain-containing protein [Salinarimonadaceae bacterium]|nr:MAG: DUF427 domain-containing protein [Salinarimonadaceae bacterium]